MAGFPFLPRFTGDPGWMCHWTVAGSSVTSSRMIRFGGLDPGGTDHREHFLSNSADWWINRRVKAGRAQPRLQQESPDQTLCLDNQKKLISQLTTLDVQLHTDLDEVQEFPTDEGHVDMTLDVLVHMDQQGIVPSATMYVSLMRACAKGKALPFARQVHAHLSKHRLASTRFLGEYMVSTLVQCGGFEDALQVFRRLEIRTVFSWTAVISGFSMSGKVKEALLMYQCMLDEGTQPNTYTFVSLLKACRSIADLEQGKRIHGEVVKYRCESDLFVSTCLLDMYARCGSIRDARNVFDGLSHRDLVSWNAIFAAYIQQGDAEKGLQLYENMREEGVTPDQRTFVSVLQACGMVAEEEIDVLVDGQATKVMSLRRGKVVHSDAHRKGYSLDLFVGNTLVSMYAKCGSILDARNAFDGLSHQDVVSWTAMMVGYVKQSQAEQALKLYEQMMEEGMTPNAVTFASLLQACGMLAETEKDVVVDGQPIKLQSLHRGRIVHASISRNGYDSDICVCSTLVSMYGRCGTITDAEFLFDALYHRDMVSWTTMLMAYVEQGQMEHVFHLYDQMLEEGVSPDKGTFVIMIQACGILADKEEEVVLNGQPTKVCSLEKGKAMHAEAQRKRYNEDIFIGSTVVSMYGKCGSITDALTVFERLSQQNLVSWTAILAACTQQDHFEKALQLYEDMLEEGIVPNDRTFVSVLQACGMLAEEEEGVFLDGLFIKVQLLDKGKAFHADAWRMGHDTDVFVANTLISMYGKCHSSVDAWNVFTKLSKQDIVSWTAMSAAYVQQGEAEKALQLYVQMQEEGLSPNDVTFVTALQACGMLADNEDNTVLDGQSCKVKSLVIGKAVHGDAWRRGYNSGVLISALITLYGTCGSLVDAWNVFNGLSKWSIPAGTAMVMAYVEQGQGQKAWQLYREAHNKGVSLDEITLVCILQACSKAGSLNVCKQIHRNLDSIMIGRQMTNTLINAYGRCASMVDARAVFDALQDPDVESWTALIAGYARQGNYAASLQCFDDMQLAGVKPNSVTFLSLLSACSHAGLVDKGVEYLESMSRDHGITPDIDHYVSVVDLLGRAGYFATAERLLSAMPTPPSPVVWLCLLAACRKHGNLVLGKQAFDCAVHIDPNHSAPYVMMSNMYADAGLWDKAKEVAELRRKGSVRKKPGQSWIEHEHNLYAFMVEEQEHPHWDPVHYLLGKLTSQLYPEEPIRKIVGDLWSNDFFHSCNMEAH